MKKIALLLCILMILPLVLVAQEMEEQPPVSEQGIQVGHFIFTPSLELIYEDKDNVFLRPKKSKDPLGVGEQSDQLYTARATFTLEYPFAENYFRMTWSPQWRDYNDANLDENWTNVVDLAAVFDTPSGVEATIANHFIQGALEVSEIDPGHELVYGDQAFTKNETTFDLKYFFTPTDGFGIFAKYDDFSYDDDNPLWYDYTSYTAGLSYQRQLNPLLRMAVGADYTNYDADNSKFSEVTSRVRDYDGYNAYVQFYGSFSPVVNADLKMGYESLSFDAPSDFGDRDYDDWSAAGNLTWEVAEGQDLKFTAIRRAYPSNFSDVSSYTHNNFGIKYDAQLAAKTFFGLGATIYNNDYNERSDFYDKTRSDDGWQGKVQFGYHFNTYLSARFNYIHEEKDSNINAFDYEVNIWMVNFVIGY